MLKKTLTLEDVLPSKPEFSINKKVFSIRPPTLEDQVWIKATFGSPEAFVNSVFSQDINWPGICRFVYHQLSNDDRAHFPATQAKIIDEHGRSMEVEITGPEMLLRALGDDLENGMKMVTACTRAIVASNPLLEEAFEKEVKKNLKSLSIGEKSSINSLVNMGGRKTK